MGNIISVMGNIISVHGAEVLSVSCEGLLYYAVYMHMIWHDGSGGRVSLLSTGWYM